jgi:glycosyltransferase involved in cell wall biosynthesis
LIDAYLACSEKAAHYLFPSVIMKKRHYDIIHSGIDIERFMFKQLERDTYRKELGIEGRVAVDLVGRFDDVKNQEFAVDILCELRKMIRCVLIFVGTGERTNYIKKLVTEKNAHNDVIFLGFRNDVDSIMQALDVLILPSIYEGFPVTVVEATCCGLPCIVSGEACEKSIEVLGRIKLRSIHDTPRNWCMDIIDMLCYVRDDNSNRIREEKYSIKDTVSVLEQYYSGVDK